MKSIGFLQEEKSFQSTHIPPIIAFAIGVLLWFVPTLLLPVFGGPIDVLLRNIGLLAASAGEFESRFTAALVLRWLAVALLLIFVLMVERLPLRSVGIRKLRWVDLFLAIGGGLVALVLGMTLYLLIKGPEPDPQTQTGQIIITLSLLGKLHLLLNAAIVEELFFRGFLIERVTALTQRIWIGGIVSFVVFVVSHISGSGLSLALTMVSVGTLVFVSLYVWRRNIFVCIVAHAISNITLLLSAAA